MSKAFHFPGGIQNQWLLHLKFPWGYDLRIDHEVPEKVFCKANFRRDKSLAGIVYSAIAFVPAHKELRP